LLPLIYIVSPFGVVSGNKLKIGCTRFANLTAQSVKFAKKLFAVIDTTVESALACAVACIGPSSVLLLYVYCAVFCFCV
jgi:hypothetical protein